MHLIYAAYATTLDKPWEQEFVISDRQIEDYLGLDKRKDLSKSAKLTLIKELAQQPCRITTCIDWPGQGKVKGFSVEESRLWHLLSIEHHFQEDAIGCKHLIGLTFRVRAGLWTQYFLNKQGCKECHSLRSVQGLSVRFSHCPKNRVANGVHPNCVKMHIFVCNGMLPSLCSRNW